MGSLDVAWRLKNPNVSVTLLGASKTSQITDNVKPLDLYPKLDDKASKTFRTSWRMRRRLQLPFLLLGI